jgi:hypothetical protein
MPGAIEWWRHRKATAELVPATSPQEPVRKR